jgi:hypothetical protein
MFVEYETPVYPVNPASPSDVVDFSTATPEPGVVALIVSRKPIEDSCRAFMRERFLLSDYVNSFC